jgi:hypothetical protein
MAQEKKDRTKNATLGFPFLQPNPLAQDKQVKRLCGEDKLCFGLSTGNLPGRR